MKQLDPEFRAYWQSVRSGSNEVFQADPVAWVRSNDEEVWSEQAQILESVRDNRYTAVHSAHDLGKSFIASRAIAWWIDTHLPGTAFVVSTAPSAAQVSAIMWREVTKIHKKAQLSGQINRAGYPQWYIDGTLVGYGRKPADYEQSAFQGIHEEYVLIVIDEACHDDQTEVLTEDGWRFFADLVGTERLLTMDPDTHTARYTLPEKIIKKHYSGKMHTYDAKDGNFSVTPNHDLLYRTATGGWHKEQAQSLAGKTDRFMKKAIEWHDKPGSVSGDWAEFLGWYFSEGSIGFHPNGPGSITLSQKHEGNTDRIEALVSRLGLLYSRYPDGVRIRSSALAREFAAYGRGCLVKTIPSEMMQAGVTAIRRFLDAFELGDGYRKGKGGILYTSNSMLADQLQELCLKTGVPSVLRKREMPPSKMRDGRVIPGSTGYVVTRPHQSTDMKVRGGAIKEVDYNGWVYCASVPPDALLFTRRNGYTLWSGNCGVNQHLYDAVDSLATNENARVLAIGNPDDPGSHFAKVCQPGSGWNTIHLDGLRSPNITYDRVVGDDPENPAYPLLAALMEAEGIPYSTEPVPDFLRKMLVNERWIEERIERWANLSRQSAEHTLLSEGPEALYERLRVVTESSAIFTAKVRGIFPTSATEDAVIPLGWARRAMERWRDQNSHGPAVPGDFVLGVDVARSGGDQTVFAHRYGSLVKRLERLRVEDTTIVADRAATYLHEPRSAVVVDVIGIGAGVFDLLRRYKNEAKIVGTAYPWNASARTPMKDDIGQFKYLNDRAAAWWRLRELLDPSKGSQIALPDDEELLEELIAPKYGFNVGGTIKIEEKAAIKKRIGRSTDSADAVVACFWVGNDHSPMEAQFYGQDNRRGRVIPYDGFEDWSKDTIGLNGFDFSDL